jgi:hypothetical protein
MKKNYFRHNFIYILMSHIPYFIVITKPNKQRIQVNIINDTGIDLTDIYNKIIKIIHTHLMPFKDLPYDYDEFIYKCWFANMSADAAPFEYKIY